MKKKSFIMPVVLIIFSFVFMISFSMYIRFIGIQNLKNSKQSKLERKIDYISFDEIFKLKKFRDFINEILKEKNYKKTYFEEKFKLTDILVKIIDKNILSKDFINKYKDYKVFVILEQKRTDNFFKNNFWPLPNTFFNYELFLTVKNEKSNTVFEYRVVDREKIENYLVDTIVNKAVNDENINFNKFYFDIKKAKSLQKRIFSSENGEVVEKNVRFFNVNKDIFYIDNDKYNEILKKYILEKLDDEVEIEDDFSCDIVNLDNLFSKDFFKNASKEDFIKNYLLDNSMVLYKDYHTNLTNFIINDKVYFDFDKELSITTNLNFTKDFNEIFVTKEIPTVKGIFIYDTDKSLDINLEGILFSKEYIKNYKFSPKIINSSTKLMNISDNYYMDRIDYNIIK